MFIRYEENASPDIEQAVREGYIAVFPLGCTEQHGPHLPLSSDCRAPIEAVGLAAEKYGIKALVLPMLAFGTAAEHTTFPGTISLSFATWSTLVIEVLDNLVRDGFRKIVITKHCGGHVGIEGPIYEYFCRKRRELGHLAVRVHSYWNWPRVSKLILESEISDPNEVHAGGVETSMVLAASPHLVHLDRLCKPQKQVRPLDPNWWVMDDLSETGATGDPTKYNAELGKAIVRELDSAFADFLGEMWGAKT